ncbi:MAG TPA: hypothetical protein VN175_04425 [Rhizomicrobium sp.]|nr:hypothetical protein [Rhizomicrobium sp.]
MITAAFLAAPPVFAAELPTACSYLSSTVQAQAPGPKFLASFPTVKSGPLQDAAFLYDNAVAAIALVACGNPNAAAQIGDAMLAALDRDRFWHDGRLRNGYLAGPVGPGPVKLAGWWDAKQNMWVEDRYQVGSDNGNMAWAILALLALDRATADGKYRNGAIRIGTWIKQWRSEIPPGGFTGGTFAHEPVPISEKWKSTEHNTDLTAAFTRLARATGDKGWMVEARAAQEFVRAMWRPECGCFAVGTTEDGKTRNLYLALDAQTWPLLAIPDAAIRYKEAAAPARLRDGDGFAYSEAKEGVWTEGTAQVALLLELSGHSDMAENLLTAVDAMRAPDGSYYAASTRELPTGFMLETDPTQPRQYFHIAHLAAASWAAIAQQRYNPFTGAKSLP